MYYLNTINFKRKVNINRDNIYIIIYIISLYIYKRKCNKQPTRHGIGQNVYAMFTRFCESRRRFFPLLSPLNILHTLFFLSALSVPSLLPCFSLFPSSTPPGARPSAFLPPVFLPSACPPLLLSVVCAVAAVCVLLCPLPSPRPRVLSRPVFCVRAPEALRRPSVCPAVCRLAPAVTRPPSGAKRCGSVGRYTAYMSPALSPPVYVLPCVPLPVPCLVLPAVVCPLVVVTAYTPLYPGRRLFGAASAM